MDIMVGSGWVTGISSHLMPSLRLLLLNTITNTSNTTKVVINMLMNLTNIRLRLKIILIGTTILKYGFLNSLMDILMKLLIMFRLLLLILMEMFSGLTGVLLLMLDTLMDILMVILIGVQLLLWILPVIGITVLLITLTLMIVPLIHTVKLLTLIIIVVLIILEMILVIGVLLDKILIWTDGVKEKVTGIMNREMLLVLLVEMEMD